MEKLILACPHKAHNKSPEQKPLFGALTRACINNATSVYCVRKLKVTPARRIHATPREQRRTTATYFGRSRSLKYNLYFPKFSYILCQTLFVLEFKTADIFIIFSSSTQQLLFNSHCINLKFCSRVVRFSVQNLLLVLEKLTMIFNVFYAIPTYFRWFSDFLTDTVSSI